MERGWQHLGRLVCDNFPGPAALLTHVHDTETLGMEELVNVAHLAPFAGTDLTQGTNPITLKGVTRLWQAHQDISWDLLKE